MRLKRIGARVVSRIFSLRPVRSKEGLRILLYHSVGSLITNNYYGISVGTKAFERQMNILSQTEGLEFVSLDQSQLRDRRLLVAITFDDGFKDNLYSAAPVLAELNTPFTVFITASFVGSGSSDYLSKQELRELCALPGAVIGSHGVTHCRLTECDGVKLARELTDSRRMIEDMIGRPVTAISYPHGSVNKRVRDAAERAGYAVGCTSQFGANDNQQDPLLLRRCEIVSGDTERIFIEKLNGHWDWKAWIPQA